MEAAVEVFDLEAGGSDRRLGVARRPAATEGTGPDEGIDRTLEHPERRVSGADVLPEAELAARDHDSP
jgi:hypothetical protein